MNATGSSGGVPSSATPTGWQTVYGPSVTMDWAEVSGATYEVKVYFYNGSSWNYYYAYTTTDSEKTFWPAIDDTYYAFSVRAKGGSGSGEWSDKNYFYFNN